VGRRLWTILRSWTRASSMLGNSLVYAMGTIALALSKARIAIFVSYER